ncbi:MAG: methyltransferase domain-containing protein [Candidatus Colwellbacteria bacterium]|nr:methyltransferase domain-containing protein [Candidatus Colwellbacteria bacterium]
MTAKNDTSWGNVADWYKGVVSEEGSYQKDLILPNLLRMMGISKGENILDLACGEGFMSRALKERGATVTGVDISPELIALAKKSSEDIDFRVSPADKLSFIADSSLDKAVIILAVQNMEDPIGVFNECSRIIRSGGCLYLVINHPCFRVLKGSSWGYDAEGMYRRIDRYLSELKVDINIHPGLKDGKTTLSFHRPLQYFTKALNKAGFAISRLEEWNSGKTSQPGPRAAAENRARKEIPLFMALECRKL